MKCSGCGRPTIAKRCKACSEAEAPAASEPAAPRRGRRRIPLSGLSGAKYSSGPKLLLLALLGALAIPGAIFWVVASSADARLEKQGIFDNEVVIQPHKEFGYIIIVGPMGSSYKFEVTPLNGRAVMAVGRVDDGDSNKISDGDLAKALEDPSDVEQGKTGTKIGSMSRGRYLWVVANLTDKPLRVRIRFG